MDTEAVAKVLKRTTPSGRKPGHWTHLKIVNSPEMFDEFWPQFYAEMGCYKAVGFDVECVNYKNAATFYYQNSSPSQQNTKGDDDDDGEPAVENVTNFRMPVKATNDKRTRKENSVLIQLATWSGFVLLIRLCYLPHVPIALRHFLADSSVLKLGVGIEVDACRLWNDWGLLVRGWLDLRQICIDLAVDFRDFSFQSLGLKTLARTLFGEPDIGLTVTSMKRISYSDWTAPKLNDDQLRYAAWDVQISVDIFSFGTQMLYSLEQPNSTDEQYYANVFEKCKHIVETPGVMDEDLIYDEQVRDDDCTNEEDDATELGKIAKLLAKFKPTSCGGVIEKLGHLKKVPGENILSIDAQKLVGLHSIGEREIITADFDENLIRLYLPPSSTGEPICIVCGEKDFSKCCLVPIVSPLYMRYVKFQIECLCNDVWLCFSCRNNWLRDGYRLTMELAVLFDAPVKKFDENDDDPQQLQTKKSAGSPLNKNVGRGGNGRNRNRFGKISHPNRGFHTIHHCYAQENSTTEIDASHESIVMRRFAHVDDFTSFDRMWRQHFYELMQPQYLPQDWCVEHDAMRCAKRDERKNYFLRKTSSLLSDEDEIMASTSYCTTATVLAAADNQAAANNNDHNTNNNNSSSNNNNNASSSNNNNNNNNNEKSNASATNVVANDFGNNVDSSSRPPYHYYPNNYQYQYRSAGERRFWRPRYYVTPTRMRRPPMFNSWGSSSSSFVHRPPLFVRGGGGGGGGSSSSSASASASSSFYSYNRRPLFIRGSSFYHRRPFFNRAAAAAGADGGRGASSFNRQSSKVYMAQKELQQQVH